MSGRIAIPLGLARLGSAFSVRIAAVQYTVTNGTGTESSRCKWLVSRTNCGAEAIGSALSVAALLVMYSTYSTSPMYVIV